MTRSGPARPVAHAALCLIPLLVIPRVAGAPPGGAESPSVATMLRVQKAFRQGRAEIESKKYADAVTTLEAELARIDGNHEYLDALREAYRGLIEQRIDEKKYVEIGKYVRRLEILDPGATNKIIAKLPKNVADTLKAPPKASPPKLKVRAKGEDPPALPVKSKILPPSLELPPFSQPRKDAKDPFRLENFKQLPEAKKHFEQAEQLFLAKKYKEAGRLYELAHQAVPDVVEPARERWAFCRLSRVVEQLNSPARTASYDELEKQTELALELTTASSKLAAYGESLRKMIQSRRDGDASSEPAKETGSASVDVRHSQPSGSRWKIAETTSFRIYHNQSREFAERVAEIAEKTRADVQQRWFGKGESKWSSLCEIYLHADADDYSRATQVSAQSPGHATTKRKGSRVQSRRIDLHVDLKETLDSILPHEAAHVCLAGQFGPYDLPRWADEGIAILTEPAARREQYARILPQARQQGRLFRVRSLMEMKDWPRDLQDVTMFHAQSVSIVEYLCRLKGHQTFAQFLHVSLSGDFESSLKRFYGLRGYDDLESRWLKDVFGR